MADVVWLASYPKAGNTWLRFLIAHLVHGDVPDSRTLQALVPDVHRTCDVGAGAGARLVKTHWLFENLPREHRTQGFIYIARNPFDLVASNVRFALLCAYGQHGKRPGHDDARERAALAERFIRCRGEPRWMQLGYGTFDEHVRSWRAAAERVPSLFLRYEDLLEDPFAQVGRIAGFLGLEPDTGAIGAAIRNSSFDAMRRLEEHEIGARKPGLFWGDPRDAARTVGHRFMSRGGVSLGRDELSVEARRCIATVFAGEIAMFGYDAASAEALAA